MYLIRQVGTMTYYSDILGKKQCIYGFKYKKHAVLFKQFLNDFKSVHKRYPSTEQAMFSSKFLVNTDPVCIEEFELEHMKIQCVMNGLDLFEVQKFDYDSPAEVYLSGSHQTEGIEPFEVKEHLDYIFRLPTEPTP
jgi:hypothetical protein